MTKAALDRDVRRRARRLVDTFASQIVGLLTEHIGEARERALGVARDRMSAELAAPATRRPKDRGPARAAPPSLPPHVTTLSAERPHPPLADRSPGGLPPQGRRQYKCKECGELGHNRKSCSKRADTEHPRAPTVDDLARGSKNLPDAEPPPYRGPIASRESRLRPLVEVPDDAGDEEPPVDQGQLVSMVPFGGDQGDRVGEGGGRRCSSCGKSGHNRQSCGREPKGPGERAKPPTERVEIAVTGPRLAVPRGTRRRGGARSAERPRGVTVGERGQVHLNVLQAVAEPRGAEWEAVERPKTRGECLDMPRPCPFVGCRHHLYLDVSPAGSLMIVRPDVAPWELRESCSLDVAERGAVTLDEVGEVLNVTRERSRQIEIRGLINMRRAARGAGLEGTEGSE